MAVSAAYSSMATITAGPAIPDCPSAEDASIGASKLPDDDAWLAERYGYRVTPDGYLEDILPARPRHDGDGYLQDTLPARPARAKAGARPSAADAAAWLENYLREQAARPWRRMCAPRGPSAVSATA